MRKGQADGGLLERDSAKGKREGLWLLSSYSNNSSNPRCGTDRLRGVW